MKIFVLLRSLLIIFGLLGIGELIVDLTGISIPSSIVGMLLLTAGLQQKWIKEEWVREFSELLIKNLGLLFVPPAVGIMQYFGIISNNLPAFLLAVIVSTVAVMLASGWIFMALNRKK